MPDANASASATAKLIARMEANEAEAAEIRNEAEALGLDAKKIKTIRKAKADADAAQRTYAALVAEGLVPGAAPSDGGAA